jgi:hypothetical protein
MVQLPAIDRGAMEVDFVEDLVPRTSTGRADR